MLTEIKELGRISQEIGRWTAAETYREYLTLRVMYYQVSVFAILYSDYQETGVWGFSDKQVHTAEDLQADFEAMDAWANSEYGFQYNGDDGVKTCEGDLQNDLNWQLW